MDLTQSKGYKMVRKYTYFDFSYNHRSDFGRKHHKNLQRDSQILIKC